jgi:hypothetical protein
LFIGKDWVEQEIEMRRILPIGLVSCVLIIAQPLFAQDLQVAGPQGFDQSRGQLLHVAQSNGKTLSQAVEQVRRQYKGRIVSAETKRSGNREVHHIKVLMEGGKVKTVRVNGRTLGKKG